MKRALLPASLSLWLVLSSSGAPARADLDARVGQPVDVAPSAYAYRADRRPGDNPPEGWILLMQHANLPFDRPVDVQAPAVKNVLCGRLWEEVRPVRRVELTWTADARNRPTPDALALTYFDATDSTAHTWWNPRTIKGAGKPQVSPDGLTYSYAIPVDTWGIVAALREGKEASSVAVPDVHAFVPDTWKKLDIEVEWGFDAAKAGLAYDGRIEAYDGVIADVRPLDGDTGTTITVPSAWRSARVGTGRRGVRLSVLYMGTSRWRKVWPYHAQPEDVPRTILTLWTRSGNVSFLASDLEQGPILASEYGFFVRATGHKSAPATAAPSVPRPQPQTLVETFKTLPGLPKVEGWSLGGMPWFGVNNSSEPGKAGSLTIPARCAAMHPAPDRDVAVAWRSPIEGRVHVTGKLAMADAAGGNGIAWSLVKEGREPWQLLAQGTLDTGGAQQIRPNVAEIAVKPGDSLSLIVSAKGGDHICDTTIVDLTVREVGDSHRTWNLAGDVVATIHAGNPHAAAGNPGVWHFYAAEAMPSASSAPSEPPFALASKATSALEFEKELKSRGLQTIRQRVRAHPEQTWEGAVSALRGDGPLPPHPTPPFEPAMQVDVPSARLNAQWKLGAWHILRRSTEGPDGVWRFNDYPFGILASETYMILRALDLQGMHRETADGLGQWLSLPTDHHVVPGSGGHHPWALPDRPLGHFSDGRGALTHAEGTPGAGGHMDGVHAMGPGAIMFTLTEHFLLTGDLDALRAAAPRMKANAEWILRQRKLLAGNIPGGHRLWSQGLQPAHVVTPDSERMHMQFYESEAYYWLAVKRMATLLARIDPAEGARLDAEAEAYRKDLVAAIDRSIALTPVVAVRDGTYHSFIPFAPYVRGFAAGTWGWRRCQGHVGAIYWDTVQSADPLVSPAGLLRPDDPRVQGHLDVLEDRLLLENTKVNTRTPGYDPERDWFGHASWQYQCGLERHANIHLAADDAPGFLRSMLNQYAVDIMPGEYTFREHTTAGPPDKIYEESCFLERFRNMLVMEDGDTLWLARATPRAWLEPGQKIAVRNAPTHFGPTSYTIVSDLDHGTIRATVDLPPRAVGAVLLRIRHPHGVPIESAEVNGKAWTGVDRGKEVVRLAGLKGRVEVVCRYRALDRQP